MTRRVSGRVTRILHLRFRMTRFVTLSTPLVTLSAAKGLWSGAQGRRESDKDSSPSVQNDRGGGWPAMAGFTTVIALPLSPEYSPCHPERSEGSWEWRRVGWRVTKILRLRLTMTGLGRESDKDSSPSVQNDRGYHPERSEGAREDKSGWSAFLRHPVNRGLSGVQLIIPDACQCLVRAAKLIEANIAGTLTCHAFPDSLSLPVFP